MKQTAGVKLIDKLLEFIDESNWDEMTGAYLLGYKEAVNQIHSLIDEFQEAIYIEAGR